MPSGDGVRAGDSASWVYIVRGNWAGPCKNCQVNCPSPILTVVTIIVESSFDACVDVAGGCVGSPSLFSRHQCQRPGPPRAAQGPARNGSGAAGSHSHRSSGDEGGCEWLRQAKAGETHLSLPRRLGRRSPAACQCASKERRPP